MIVLEELIHPKESKLHSIKRYNNLPYKKGRNNRICWLDNADIRYVYDITKDNTLYIQSPLGYYPDSIVEYINKLPKEIKTVVLELKSNNNETAGLNMLFDTLRRNKPNKNVIIPINNNKFGLEDRLEYYGLPKNVKISNTFNNYTLEDDEYYGENSFDWWVLHLNKFQFDYMLLHLTKESAERAKKMRTIAEEFRGNIYLSYRNIESMTELEKANIAYDWLCRVTKYDNGSAICNKDGIMVAKPNCEYASDPIETLNRRRGLCTGRSRLLKLLLNNRYMKVPCYLVEGKNAAGSNHEWVEIRVNNGIYYYDPSYGIRGETNITHEEIKHSDYEVSGDLSKYNQKEYRRTPYPTYRKSI